MSRPPNILFIMADQMAAPALPFHGHPVVKTPNLSRLAAEGVVFDNAYCNYPLCAPSRFALLAGRLPSAIGAFDNAAEFASSVPTFVHHARAAGYRTCLSGKMHFVGADQLHGFEERLTTDVYPADFGWTPDWGNGALAYDWSHHMASVVEAGPCHRSLQIDFDEETAHQAVQKIYDYGRTAANTADRAPFLLAVSFTHPHDPFNCLPEHWNLYDHAAIDLPSVPPIPPEQLDPHSRRLHHMDGLHRYDLTEERVRTARHAYYGSISYVDGLVGRLLTALERAGLAEDTIIVFTGDHGEMLGERGMWYKMTFFEWSSRVPLLVHAPGRWAPGRVSAPVSHVDLFPTLLDLFGDRAPPPVDPLDGTSLMPLLDGAKPDGNRSVFAEYLGEGALEPAFMVRQGRYKYVVCGGDPAQLYDLEADPRELVNRAGDPAFATVEAELADAVARRWDAAALRRAVVESQNRRLFVHKVLLTGRHTPWDYQPHRNAATSYVRNFGVAEDTLKALARLPAVEPVPPDRPEA
ncbi:choline-sulfatase [Azospirillum brasilense]|uniref:Choline-sulfatase n=1 Tax=Azospirillum brasilense TaxID=192 RepID=A0A235HD65_AZOBR|nr:choline-sulfatase [Azospirillum brasilense]OYD83666.1 choline-sulfatase [Azospirillum brasilense]